MHLKKSLCYQPVHVIMLTKDILFAWKNLFTHSKSYAYHQSLTFYKGPLIKLKIFIKIVSVLKLKDLLLL